MNLGCNKFLDQQPQDFASSTTFYQNATQVKEVLNGAYGGLQSLYAAGGNFWALTEMRSDNTTFEYNNEDRGSLQLENVDYFQVTTDNNYLESIWSSIYNTIAQCNGVISHIDDVTYDSDTVKNQIYGQALFLRSLLYFHLVRLWGSVPLVLDVVDDPSDAYHKKATVDSLYAQIIQDAVSATGFLPDNWPSADLGRATKGAANTLLGEVYLTRKQYQKAIDAFDKVTGYSLMASYSALYLPANKNNTESIFEIQFSNAIEGEASNYLYHFAPLYSGFKTIGSFDPNSGSGRNIPTRDLLGDYESGDLRKTASIAWFVDPLNVDKGYVEAQHDSVPYINKYAAKPTVSGKQDNDFYVYRYAQVLLWKAEAINELSGPISSAYTAINQVRKRAGLKELSSVLNQEKFRTAVYHEQRMEDAFENHRWFQLLRTGKAKEVMTANGQQQKTYQSWLPASSYDLQDYKLLFPIPLTEIQLNGIEQNEGW
jgi:hypothetical protein